MNMRKTFVGLITATLVTAVTMVTGTATPAHAAGSVSSSNGVLFDGCSDHAFSYSFYAPGATEWDLDATLTDPAGDQSDFAYEYGDGDTASGSSSVSICDWERPGVYTIDVTVTWYDADYNAWPDQGSATFSMREARTRTSLHVSDRTPRFDAIVTLKIHSTEEHPNGYFGNEYEYVALEYWAGGAWDRVRGSKTLTADYGNARLKYRWNLMRPIRIRAVTLTPTRSHSPGTTVDAHAGRSPGNLPAKAVDGGPSALAAALG